jgi:hypothetical protein
MELVDSQEPIETTTHPERFPRLWGVIVFRLVVTALGISLFIAALSRIKGPVVELSFYDFICIAIGVTFLSICSLIIIPGLFFRKRWAGWLVFLFDAVLVSFRAGNITPTIITEYWTYHDLLPLLVVGPFIWEGLYVSTKLWESERAKTRYYAAALIFFVLGVTGNRIMYYRQFARIKPVFTYVDSHLWNIPMDFNKFKLKQELSNGGFYLSELQHIDNSDRTQPTKIYSFNISSYDNLGYKHRIWKKWKGIHLHISSEDLTKVNNQGDMLKLLRKNGARIPDLRYVKSEDPWKGAKFPKDWPPLMDTDWEFQSRSTGIEYDVSGMLNSDSSLTVQNINISIPEKEYNRLKKNGWK